MAVLGDAGAAARQELKVHFIYVGYGDASLIQFPDGKNVLLDSGPADKSAALTDYLMKAGVDKLEAAIITHPHDNHFGGLSAVLERFPVGRVYVNGDERGEPGYSELLAGIKNKNIPIEVLRRGQALPDMPEGVSFLILHPKDLNGSVNGNAIVSWLKYGKTSFVFMADVEKDEQEEIFKEFKGLEEADCITTPHHGRDISKKFVKTFAGRDKFFIVSFGENAYGKVDRVKLGRLTGKVFELNFTGSVAFVSDGKRVGRINE